MNDVPFAVLLRMMADASWTAEKGDKKEEVIDVTDNPERLLKLVNGIKK